MVYLPVWDEGIGQLDVRRHATFADPKREAEWQERRRVIVEARRAELRASGIKTPVEEHYLRILNGVDMWNVDGIPMTGQIAANQFALDNERNFPGNAFSRGLIETAKAAEFAPIRKTTIFGMPKILVYGVGGLAGLVLLMKFFKS